jgi:hypothetical protein
MTTSLQNSRPPWASTRRRRPTRCGTKVDRGVRDHTRKQDEEGRQQVRAGQPRDHPRVQQSRSEHDWLIRVSVHAQWRVADGDPLPREREQAQASEVKPRDICGDHQLQPHQDLRDRLEARSEAEVVEQVLRGH